MTTKTISKAKPLDDLELYEVLVAAYPERFAGREDKGEDIWNEVMEFGDEICAEMDQEALCDLLGRLVMLTMPMQAALSGKPRHALGTITIHDGQARMAAAVSRDVDLEEAAR